MKKSNSNFRLYLPLAAALVLYLLSLEQINIFNFSDDVRNGLLVAAIGSIVTFVLVLLGSFIDNRRRLWLWLRCLWLSLIQTNIRFSMSYLYLIEVEGKFLLVKSANFDHQYQFVGGKYKVYEAGQRYLESIGASQDDKLKVSGVARDDLALFLPAKSAMNFLDWFNSMRDREISHWREFYEELIGSDIQVLSEENFPHVNYYLDKTVITSVRDAPIWDNCKEILQYDVLRLKPNTEQLKELELLLKKGDTDYLKWADPNLIKSLGFNESTREQEYVIGAHTKWALQGFYSK